MSPEAAPLLGTFLHAIGAASAALCYSPQKFLHKWSWESYWLVQAVGCWLVFPWIFAYFTIPELGAVLAEAPSSAMWRSYLLGVGYGVGGIAFGLSIRYIGFSLTYAIAIGLSCALGTLVGPLMAGELGQTLSRAGGNYVVGGVLLGTVAIILTGLAGFRKERELDATGQPTKFNAHLGLPICIVAGILSAVYSFALNAGQPIAEVARAHGAGQFEGNVVYIFANNGAFTTTFFYILYLATRKRTWGEFRRTSDGRGLLRNYVLALATGLMWYVQWLFYGLAHVRMGDFRFSSWAIHMIILILLSSGFGVLIGEWRGARRRTVLYMVLALLILVGAVGIITYGNYIASPPEAMADPAEIHPE